MPNGDIGSIGRHIPVSERRQDQEHNLRMRENRLRVYSFPIIVSVVAGLYIWWSMEVTGALLGVLEKNGNTTEDIMVPLTALIVSTTVVVATILLPVLNGIYRNKLERSGNGLRSVVEELLQAIISQLRSR